MVTQQNVFPHRWSLFILFVLAVSSTGHAVPFYSRINSPFPSGEASILRLEERILSTEYELQYKIRWDEKEYVRSKKQLLFDFELSDEVQITDETSLFEEPSESTPVLQKIPAMTIAPVLITRGHWVRVSYGQAKGWVHSKYVKPAENDMGFYRTFIEAPLRKSANDFSVRVATVPPLAPLRPIEFKRGWVKVKWGTSTGFMSLRYLVGKTDFAERVFVDSKWTIIRHRQDEFLISAQNEKIPLKEITKIQTYSQRGFIVGTAIEALGPKPGSRVHIVNVRGDLWIQSMLPGHGQVWWARQTTSPQENASSELLKRYENKEYPGLTTPEGIHFIGQYRSKDGGKNFEPFIRWEQVATIIRAKYNVEPQYFRITKIEPMDNSRVKMTVDIGKTKVKLVSHVHGHEVRVLK